MSNIVDTTADSYLDWGLLGSTPTRPSAVYCGLANAVPTASTPSELPVGIGYERRQALFTPASGGHTANYNVIGFGPLTTTTTVYGIQLWDSAIIGTGTMLWFGSFLEARTVLAGSILIIAPAALTVTIS